MNSQKQEWKNLSIFPLEEITEVHLLHPEKCYPLFSGSGVKSELWSDGVISEQDIRIDKFPSFYDERLKEFAPLKRYDFLIQDAHFVLIKKYIQEKSFIDLYLQKNGLDQLKKKEYGPVTQIEINEKERLKVKSLGSMIWK